MEEPDRRRVAAVLAADAELEAGPGGAALGRGDLDQAATPAGSMVSNGDTPKMPLSM